MSVAFTQMQKVLAYAAENLDSDLSLGALSAQAGLSRFHLHRLFSKTIGETPKQVTFRLRLARSALLLLTTEDSVLDIALSCGFQNHETFSRAFQRRFGMPPRKYRKRGFVQRVNKLQARDHAVAVNKLAPCLGLYSMQTIPSEGGNLNYSVKKIELTPQPVLIVRRRVKRSEIASTIAESLPHIFVHAQQHGIALAGLPFTRYIEIGPGLITMEPGMRIAASDAIANQGGETRVIADTLPGGPTATTTHIGPYEGLPDAYAAIQQWMESQLLVSGGAPWESYVTDPAEHPDPKDWKTEIYWPLKT